MRGLSICPPAQESPGIMLILNDRASHSRLVIFSLLTVAMCFLTHTLTIFYFLKPQSFPNQNHARAAMCRCCRKAEPLKNACLGSLKSHPFFLCVPCWLEFHSCPSKGTQQKVTQEWNINWANKTFLIYSEVTSNEHLLLFYTETIKCNTVGTLGHFLSPKFTGKMYFSCCLCAIKRFPWVRG